MKKKTTVLENTDKIIDYHLRFQDLLISLSTKYINADLSEINTLIHESLEQIGVFVNADRSYIFTYDFNSNTTSNTHEWCSTGTEPEIDNLQNVPIEFIQVWLDAHKNGKAFYVEDVSKLPDEGEMSLRNILEPQGIKSLIAIPMICDDDLVGFVGFDSVKKLHKYTDNEKNILFVFANMLVNIRKRKEQEDLIKEQEKRKELLLKNLSEQNEKLNDYAQIVSHDLKAPLINIHNLVDWFIFDNKEQLGEPALIPLKEVLFNVEKMDILIKGILEYSLVNKKDAVNSVVNLNDVLEDILRVIAIPTNINIALKNNLPYKIKGNKWKFQQLFQNLIQNAIKFNDKKDGVISIGYKEKKKYYEFYVSDNGVGINPMYFDKIFKAFTKLESESSSSGIGLSIVKRIVEFYDGKIWVESKEGEYTTFFFTLKKQA